MPTCSICDTAALQEMRVLHPPAPDLVDRLAVGGKLPVHVICPTCLGRLVTRACPTCRHPIENDGELIRADGPGACSAAFAVKTPGGAMEYRFCGVRPGQGNHYCHHHRSEPAQQLQEQAQEQEHGDADVMDVEVPPVTHDMYNDAVRALQAQAASREQQLLQHIANLEMSMRQASLAGPAPAPAAPAPAPAPAPAAPAPAAASPEPAPARLRPRPLSAAVAAQVETFMDATDDVHLIATARANYEQARDREVANMRLAQLPRRTAAVAAAIRFVDPHAWLDSVLDG
jgi:hypothetical protein